MKHDYNPALEEAVRLVLAHQTMLRAYIRNFIRNRDLVEDTLSQVTLVVLKSWDEYDQSRPFSEWVKEIARRTSLANVRKEQRQPQAVAPEILDGLSQALDSLGGEVELDGRKEALECCLRRLPERHRSLVESLCLDDRSYPELSGVWGKSVGALYTAFNRARKKLQDCIHERLQS